MLDVAQLAEADSPADASQKIDPNKPASRIAARFGGLAAFAAALGKNPSTCHRWLVSGFIPSRHNSRVMQAAREHRVKLRHADFFEDEAAPKAD
jgi:hypothetical protein